MRHFPEFVIKTDDDVSTSPRSFSSEVKKSIQIRKVTRRLKYAEILSNETIKAIV